MAEDIVVSYHSSVLYKDDVELLKPLQWLNDHCITFWLEVLSHEIFPDNEDILFMHPGAVFLIRFEDDLEEAFGSLQLHKKSLILLPINDNTSADRSGGSHWSLLVWYNPKPSDKKLSTLPTGFSYWDSASGWDGVGKYSATGGFTAELGTSFPAATATALKLQPLLKASSAATVVVSCAQQRNGSDCGVYTLYYAEHIARAIKDSDEEVLAKAMRVSPEAITAYRKRIRETAASKKTAAAS